jgi:ketopantoate reductase
MTYNAMKKPIIIIGLGEMGSVFARGFLKAAHPVIPLNRQESRQAIAKQYPKPELVLIAVGEKDLPASLDSLPDVWRDRVVLLQNELLPRDWQGQNLQQPTIISVWFEKKPGMDYKVLVPSPVHGPKAEIIRQALATLDIPVDIIENDDDMLFELVRKNMYILSTNICGLETGGTVKQLWDDHSILMNRVFDDVLEIQQHLTDKVFDRDKLLNAVLTAFDGDPDHKCMGRSAPDRLKRAVAIATKLKLEGSELKRIAEKHQL